MNFLLHNNLLNLSFYEITSKFGIKLLIKKMSMISVKKNSRKITLKRNLCKISSLYVQK